MKKSKIKPTSVRFNDELLSDLDEKCSGLACSRNDYITESVKLILWGSSDFDFGDEEVEKRQDPKVIDSKPQPTITLIGDDDTPIRISHDNGKTWKDVPKVMNYTVYEDDGNIIGKSKEN